MVMSAENRALCYFYRYPPKGSDVQSVKKWAQIARLVWNADGKTHPSANAGQVLCSELETSEQEARPQEGLEEDDHPGGQEHLSKFPEGPPAPWLGCYRP